APVTPVRQSPQHADHRSDADPAGDHHQTGAGSQVDTESTMRAIKPHRTARLQPAQCVREITGVPDGELRPRPLVSAGCDGEWMLLCPDKRIQPQPGKLTRRELQGPAP